MPRKSELLSPPIELDKAHVGAIEEYDYTEGPDFSEETDKVELKPDRLKWGRATEVLYEGRFKRFPPHMVMGERILIFGKIKPTPVGQDQPEIKTESHLQEHGLITVHEITAEALSKETIPPEVAQALLTDKRVEDNLQWFLIHAKNAFKDVKGLAHQYGQWDREEREHSLIDGMILETAGGMSREFIDEDYEVTQENSWKPPFRSDIQMVIYAMMQERATRDHYIRLRKLIKEVAPKSALALGLVASDEGLHGASYEDDAEAYARISPACAVEAAHAALDVGARFRMPSLHLMRDRFAETKRSMELVGDSIDTHAEVARGSLEDLSFVPNSKIDEVVEYYRKTEPRRIAKILIDLRRAEKEKAAANKVGGNGSSSGNTEDSGKNLALPSSGEIFNPQE